MEILENVDFYKAVAQMLWPLLLFVVFFSIRKHLIGVFGARNLKVKVAGMEIDIQRAADNLGGYVTELQERVAKIEEKIDTVGGGLDRAVIDGGEFSKFRILWVDDFPSNNAFIIEAFKKDGVDVDISLSTSDAIKKFTIYDYSMIISDLGRIENGVDNPFAGFDLVKSIRRTNEDIPILIFAGKRGMQSQTKLLDTGANRVTNSGVELMKFVDQIRSGVGN